MSESVRAQVDLSFDNGDVISTWESFRFRQVYTDPLGSLSFTVVPGATQWSRYRRLLAKGREVSLHIDGNLQAKMLIVDRRSTLERISVEAKSPLWTAYRGAVDPYYARRFEADTPLSRAVEELLRPYGFDSIETDTTADVTAISGKSLSGRAAPVALSELKHRDLKADFNSTAYAICARLFNRYGLTLRCTGPGRLLVGSPDYSQSALYVVVEDQDRNHSGNRILLTPEPEEFDSNETFTEVMLFGKEAGRRGTKTASPPIGGVIVEGATRPEGAFFPDVKLQTVPRGRHSYSSEAHPWKPRVYQEKRNRDDIQCEAHARTVMTSGAERAYQVRHAVDGLRSVEGAIWTVDTIGRVIVDRWELDDEMWLLGTVATGNRERQMTQLTWVPKNSLVFGAP